MRPCSKARVPLLLLGSVLAGVGAGQPGSEGPSDEALARYGLRRNGPLLVLLAESEVHAKAEEVRRLSAQLGHSVAVQRSTLSEKEYQDTIKELTAGISQLRDEINAAAQNMNRLPRSRRGRYFANNLVAEQYEDLNAYRTQLQVELQQRTNLLNQLRSRPYDRKDRIKADNEVRDRLEALHQGATDLRKQVDEVHAKYRELAQVPQVKKWLETPEGPAGVKPKLGLSRAFLNDEKRLERAERESTADDPTAQAPKASRKGRRTIKARRAGGAAGAASPS